MKIVNISGGLGNQMFQYAFAVFLKKHYPNEAIYIDTHHYHYIFLKKIKATNLHNGFELAKIFPHATIPIAHFRQVSRVSYYIPNYFLSRLCRRLLPVRKTEMIIPYSKNYIYLDEVFTEGDRYYEGNWQCIDYYQDIKDTLFDIFQHPAPNNYNKEMIEKISTTKSVGMHIRRGDYLQSAAFNNICDITYYKKAISRLTSKDSKYTFFIFSNDMDWCRENIAPLLNNSDIVYVTDNKGKDSFWDMFLMTYCKHLVIANSSFSWWGAFLNKNVESVLVPARWSNNDHIPHHLYDPSWIKI